MFLGSRFLVAYPHRELFRAWLVMFHVVGVLAALAYSGHMLMYASQDSLACRLPTSRII
ncbi:hypothetical protein ABN083_17065 [Providencia rettgeri]